MSAAKNGKRVSLRLLLTAAVLALLLCAVLFVLKQRSVRPTTDGSTTVPADTAIAAEKTTLPPAPEVGTGPNGTPVFSLTLDSFIDGFNAYYRREHPQPYLLAGPRWSRRAVDRAPHGQGRTVIYEFSRDREIWALPTVSVYVPEGDERIAEVTLNFDDHSFTPALFGEYRELCRCALRLFFPETDDTKVDVLIREQIAFADAHILPDTQWYGADAVPQTGYLHNDVAVYPYFATGDRLRICIVPLDGDTLAQFDPAGMQMREY